jgi:SAM-dependent methyltransferase
MPSEWYESFFSSLVLDFWEAAVPASATESEVDFLVRELHVAPPDRVLDLPSGSGRHSLLLARRGYDVTGVDISPHAIAAARLAAARQRVGPSFLLGDMRNAPPGAPYAGAFCAGNSFGYLSRADMVRFCQNMLDAVLPGGRWVIDTGAIAESLLPHLVEERVLEAGGVRYGVRNRYDGDTKQLLQTAQLTRGNEREQAEISYSIYTVSELQHLLEGVGWVVLRSYGSLEGTPFQKGDRRLLMVAGRPPLPIPRV